MALDVIVPQAVSVANQEIIPTAAYTSSDTAGPWPADFFSSGAITTNVSLITGGGTLNLYWQCSHDGTTFFDVASWPQYTAAAYTTTGSVRVSYVNSGNIITVTTDGAQTANTILNAHWGSYHRLKYVIAGGGTCTFGAVGDFRA